MKYKRSDLISSLETIRAFLGADWFDKQCPKKSVIEDIDSLHPIINWWIKTKAFLDKDQLHDLNVTPMQEVLKVLMLGTCLRRINGLNVVDMGGNVLDVLPMDLFRSRLRSQEKFSSAYYELQIASVYVRNNHKVSFISDDSRKSPEFVLTSFGQNIYIECKRIERRRISKSTNNKMKIVCDKIGKLLIRSGKKVGIVIECPDTVAQSCNWVEHHVAQLLNRDLIGQIEDTKNDFRFIITSLPPSTVIRAPRAHVQDMMLKWNSSVLVPWRQTEFHNANIPIDKTYPHFNFVGPDSARWELDAYVGVSFKELKNIIGGVGKLISKASGQLPKNGAGLLYIECPPYNASDTEIDAFKRTIIGKLNIITRINAIVLTGHVFKLNSVEQLSNVIVNQKSANILPQSFKIELLLDTLIFGQ